MSKTEGFLILDSQNAAEIRDKAEKTAWPCPQGVARRKLADISNLPQKPGPLNQHENSQSIPITTKEYIEHLQKENKALVRMLAQRNKIVEQSGIELERLRLTLIKMQEQNRQIALSHTQMLAELNSGKDRLKALQHELGCKSALLEARKLEVQEQASTRPCQRENAEVNLNKLLEDGESSKDVRGDEKPHNTKRRLRSHSLGSSEPLQSDENAVNKRPFTRRQTARFKTMESNDADNLSEIDLQSNENAVNKRPFARRQSARFKAVESNNAEKLSEIDDKKSQKCPLLDEQVPQDRSTCINAAVEDEDNRIKCESEESRRLSVCRPSRQAAKKVQSYKEIPLNIKMRRSG